ncbi:hypothetical protein BT93_H1535 [Corymbia citriodora subsp. variegata]|nr:hypothetical protein BT93_H1535 [Corymbia citriodora subsp. variegata]
MDVGLTQIQMRLVDYRNSLFKEGILDSLYLELQELQDESDPDFVLETTSLFFANSEKLLNDLSSELAQQNVDLKRLDAQVHRLKGSSSSIGASRVQNACIALRDFCREKNIPECLRCLQQLKLEFLLVKSKLETLFELEKQVMAAGGSIPKTKPSD